MKWEPLVAMFAMLVLGAWLVWGPRAQPGIPGLRSGARTVEIRVGDDKGLLEIVEEGSGERTYRQLFRDGSATEVLSEAQVRELLPLAVFARATDFRSNPVFRLLNITSWGSLLWIAIGFGGQLVFSCRFLVQWLVSERNRRSVIPEAFWWLSLGGGLALFAYFVWRQDLVGVLGQSSGLVIYARNLRLIHKQRRREARSEPPPGSGREADSAEPAAYAQMEKHPDPLPASVSG